MVCRTVLSAKTKLSCVNGAGGMLPGSVSCGAATQLSSQCPVISGATLPCGPDGVGPLAACTPAANEAETTAAARAPTMTSRNFGDLLNDRSNLPAVSGGRGRCLDGHEPCAAAGPRAVAGPCAVVDVWCREDHRLKRLNSAPPARSLAAPHGADPDWAK